MLTADYDLLGVKSGDRILDMGCGFGRHAYEALRRGHSVVACDLGFEELKQVRAVAGVMYEQGEIEPPIVIETTNGDATRLPFADDSFDRIICSEVMEHIDNDLAALNELERVLNPGGTLAITIPSRFPEKICWSLSDNYYAPKAPGGHVRIYKRKELTKMISDSGLNPQGHHRVHALHSPYWWLRCIIGPNKPIQENFFVKTYHQVLAWDIEKSPWITRALEKLLSPLLGKSLVVYASKPLVEAKNVPS